MEIVDFKKELENNEGVLINDDFIVFNNYELLDLRTSKSIEFKSFEDLLNYKIKDEDVKSIIEKKENFYAEDEGGRGSSSGGGNKIFGHQRGGKRVISGSAGNSFPAYMNTLVSSAKRDVDKIAKAFGKKTLNATKEYSASLDVDGFAHKYHEGKSGSTAHLVYEGGYSIHNHPVFDKKGKKIAWDIYSKRDLTNTALDNAKGTIVVSNGNRTMYKFTKTQHFKAKDFIKGLSNARSKYNDYNKDVDWWLRNNQKKYGYKYNKKKF